MDAPESVYQEALTLRGRLGSRLFELGDGFDCWFNNGMALRMEARGRFDMEYDDHVVALRVGLTF